MAFKIKQNDTSPILETTLKDPSGTVINLTGASVSFHMKRYKSSTAKVDASASIVNAVGGVVQYQWTAANTDTVGSYLAEFQVTYSDGSIETFPNSGYIQVDVLGEIA